MSQSAGVEWTEDEFQKRKQFLIDHIKSLDSDNPDIKDDKTKEIWLRNVMSSMYRIQYEKKYANLWINGQK